MQARPQRRQHLPPGEGPRQLLKLHTTGGKESASKRHAGWEQRSEATQRKSAPFWMWFKSALVRPRRSSPASAPRSAPFLSNCSPLGPHQKQQHSQAKHPPPQLDAVDPSLGLRTSRGLGPPQRTSEPARKKLLRIECGCSSLHVVSTASASSDPAAWRRARGMGLRAFGSGCDEVGGAGAPLDWWLRALRAS